MVYFYGAFMSFLKPENWSPVNDDRLTHLWVNYPFKAEVCYLFWCFFKLWNYDAEIWTEIWVIILR